MLAGIMIQGMMDINTTLNYNTVNQHFNIYFLNLIEMLLTDILITFKEKKANKQNKQFLKEVVSLKEIN